MDLVEARTALGTAAADSRLCIFARRGFSPSLEKRAEREGVLLLRARDLF